MRLISVKNRNDAVAVVCSGFINVEGYDLVLLELLVNKPLFKGFEILSEGPFFENFGLNLVRHLLINFITN